MTSFTTIDFETANSDMASICQVGIVTYENGKETDRFSTLVNPEEPFWQANIAVHGIRPHAVRSAPKLPDLYDELRLRLIDCYVISHGWFDMHCLARSLAKYELPDFERRWLDATRLVRRALPEFSQRGYGLQNIAAYYGLRTTAHDALNDAQTCGNIVLRILAQTGTELDDWVELMDHPQRQQKLSCDYGKHAYDSDDRSDERNNQQDPRTKKAANKTRPFIVRPKHQLDVEPNESGPHFGESIVFTGELSIPRDEARLVASKAGFKIKSAVSRKVQYLVCGEQDPRLVAEYPVSSKERRAHDLINNGCKIRLIKETEFLKMCQVQPSGETALATASRSGKEEAVKITPKQWTTLNPGSIYRTLKSKTTRRASQSNENSH